MSRWVLLIKEMMEATDRKIKPRWLFSVNEEREEMKKGRKGLACIQILKPFRSISTPHLAKP